MKQYNYIVLGIEPYEGYEIIGVFATRELAEKHLDSVRNYLCYPEYDIEEWEVING